MLVNVFVNEIYLYDDKLKIFFNTSNIPAEVTVDLVDEIGETEGVQGCSTMTKMAPPEKARIMRAFSTKSVLTDGRNPLRG